MDTKLVCSPTGLDYPGAGVGRGVSQMTQQSYHPKILKLRQSSVKAAATSTRPPRFGPKNGGI